MKCREVRVLRTKCVMQVCTTLGMLTPEQAKQLREAGLTAYNHNLDTSPEYYSKITSSRKYEVNPVSLPVLCTHWPNVLPNISCKLGLGKEKVACQSGCGADRRDSTQDRLETLDSVRKAGISVCAGGIIGMGEANMDRVGLLHQLATLPEHPESVPINALVAVKGTPLQVWL